ATACACRPAASSTSCPQPSCSATVPTRSPTPSARRNGRMPASPRSRRCWGPDLLCGSGGSRDDGGWFSRLPPLLQTPEPTMRLAVSFLSAALLAGCVSVATHGVPADQGPPPNDDLNATVWFQTSVERDLVFQQIYGAAAAHLDAALADKSWDALPKGDRSNDPSGLPPAIIVDVDETVLDNSPEQVRQIVDDKPF